MKKISLFILLGFLGACGGGSGGGSVPSTTTPPDTGNNEPSVPEIEEILKESEKLFGKGQGLDNIPTDLMARTDGAGFSYMSFGAWGNVYDMEMTMQEYENLPDQPVFAFMPQMDSVFAGKTQQTPGKEVAETKFKGTAIVTQRQEKTFNNQKTLDYTTSSYGTMEVAFGKNPQNYTVEINWKRPIQEQPDGRKYTQGKIELSSDDMEVYKSQDLDMQGTAHSNATYGFTFSDNHEDIKFNYSDHVWWSTFNGGIPETSNTTTTIVGYGKK